MEQKEAGVKLETSPAVKETVAGIQNTTSMSQEFLFQTVDTANAEDGQEPEQVLQSVKAGIRAETEPVRQVSSHVSKELIREAFSDEKKAVLGKNHTYRHRANIKKRNISSTLGKKVKQEAKKQTIRKAKKSAEKVRNVSKEASIRSVSQISGAASSTSVAGAAVHVAAETVNKQKDAACQHIREMKEEKERETETSRPEQGKTITENAKEQFRKSRQTAKQGFHIGLWILLLFCPIFLILSVPVLGMVIAYRSPLGIFLPKTSDKESVFDIVAGLQRDFDKTVSVLYEDHRGCKNAKIEYHIPEGDTTSEAYSNAYDIAIVYMVRYRTGYNTIDDPNQADVKAVFDEMVFYKTQEMEYEEGKKTLLIRVTKKSYSEILDTNKLTEEQKKWINVVSSGRFRDGTAGSGSDNPNLPANMGMSSLTLEQKQKLMKNLTGGEPGSEAVLFAVDKLGMPYSQANRDDGKHYDCSSLSYYAWKGSGYNLSYEGANTAAQQAKYLSKKKCGVEEKNMKPGDLVFYSFSSNGRYKDIGHVAIYCGNGMLCDASSSKGKVVYRPVYSKESIVFIGRPTKLKKGEK